jgi:hypothetical protein
MIRSAREFSMLCLSQDLEAVNKTLSENADLATWAEIIESNPERRIDVAQNRTIPSEIMRILASCDDPNVRSLIAQRRNLALDLFSKLAGDSDEMVRRKIAANQKAPLDIVRVLSADPVESVASVAQYNLRSRSEKA